MKTKFLSFIIVVFFFSLQTFAQKSQEIKVWGNCGMCKKVIEGAALKAGAKEANWNEETKILNVSFKANKTDLSKIQESIAASGYDTQDFTAPDEVYKKLHGCCQYERKSASAQSEKKVDCCKEGNCEKDKSCCKDGKCEKGKACCKA